MNHKTTTQIADRWDIEVYFGHRKNEFDPSNINVAFQNKSTGETEIIMYFKVTDVYNKDINDPKVEDAKITGWNVEFHRNNSVASIGNTLGFSNKNLREYAKNEVNIFLHNQHVSKRDMYLSLLKLTETFVQETYLLDKTQNEALASYAELLSCLSQQAVNHKTPQEQPFFQTTYLEKPNPEFNIELSIPVYLKLISDKSFSIEHLLYAGTTYVKISNQLYWNSQDMKWNVILYIPKENTVESNCISLNEFIQSLRLHNWKLKS